MNIYIGNLFYGVDEEKLREIFENYGEVTNVKLIIDRDTGRSKGFGFVEMTSEEEGQRAIEELNDTEIEGRSVKVNKARERDSQPRRNFGDRGRY